MKVLSLFAGNFYLKKTSIKNKHNHSFPRALGILLHILLYKQNTVIMCYLVFPHQRAGTSLVRQLYYTIAE
jgi:hypothetical protein